MYKIRKTLEVSASHKLNLDYDSPCGNLHGHNYIITIYLRANKLNQNGMVMDFAEIKKRIHNFFDHKNLNDIVEYNPTAESMAHHIATRLHVDRTVADQERGLCCYRVDVEETRGNIATWERD